VEGKQIVVPPPRPEVVLADLDEQLIASVGPLPGPRKARASSAPPAAPSSPTRRLRLALGARWSVHRTPGGYR